MSMDLETDPFSLEDKDNELISRYQASIENNFNLYFDSDQYEEIIEHYLELGSYELALIAIDKAIELFPFNHSFQIWKAQVCIETGQPIQAFNILSYVEKIEPDNYEIVFLKGCAYCHTGKLNDALNHFEKAIELCDENITDLYFNIAVNFIHVSEFETAIHFLVKAQESETDYFQFNYDLGYCYDQLNQNQLSIEHYNKYLDNDPFSEIVWFNLGTVYSKIEEYQKAIEAYDFSLSINDRNTLALLYKGNAYANMEEYHNAIEVYKDYLMIEEDDPEALCYVGECFERLGYIEIAMNYYNQALANDPKYSDAMYGISVVLSYQEKFAESLVWMNKAIAIEPDNPEYWFTLGNIYLKLKFEEKAIDSYNKAVELDPYDSESWLNLSEIYLKKNLLAKAINILEDSYRFNSDDTTINYRLAAYNFLKSDISQGVYYFRRGLVKNYNEHQEMFKYCPNAKDLNEVNDMLKKFNNDQQIA